MSRYQSGRYYGSGGPVGRFAARMSAKPRASTNPPVVPRPRVTGTLAQPTTHHAPTARTKAPVASTNPPSHVPLPAPPATGGLPPDPAYDQQLAGLGRTRDDTLDALRTQRHNTLLDYGYTSSEDSSGNVTGVAFDPSNPYSQAALMLRNYRQRQAGTTNSMAARGQLYSGALVDAQDATTTNYNVGEDRLQKALLGFLARNSQAQGRAKSDYETQAGVAEGEAVARAPKNPLYDATAPQRMTGKPTKRKGKKKGGH